MRQDSHTHGVKLILMTIPSQHFKSRPTRVESLLTGWAAETGTPLLNLREAFIKMPSEDQARLYIGHWTPYGAAVTARLLADKIYELMPM
jgi:hypothetical protein